MEIVQDVFYHVTVKKILPKGIIVLHDDGDSDFIHVSNISDTFVQTIEDFVHEGQDFEAQCIVGKFKPVELSLKHLKLRSDKVNNFTKSDTTDSIKKPFVGKKEFSHRRKMPTEAKAARDSSETSNLDEMIAKFNKAYEDKTRKTKHERDRSYRRGKGKRG